MELNPQVKICHGMNSLPFTQHLINLGQLVEHTALIRVD